LASESHDEFVCQLLGLMHLGIQINDQCSSQLMILPFTEATGGSAFRGITVWGIFCRDVPSSSLNYHDCLPEPEKRHHECRQFVIMGAQSIS